MREARGILFDYGGTLIGQTHFDPARGTRRLLELAARNPRGVDVSEVHARSAELRHELQVVVGALAEFPTHFFRRLLYDQLGVTFELGDVELDRQYWDAAIRTEVQQAVTEALAAVAAMGVPMGIVSNFAFSGEVILHDLAKHHVKTRFETVVASSDYGVRKPHAALFRAAAGRLGLEPRDIWFVGDSLDNDIMGARGVGMTAVWFNPRGDVWTEVKPNLEFSRWSKFPALVAGH